jgi:two-component system CheB/CheR fusion protein
VTLEVTPLTTRDGGGRHFVVLFAEEAGEEAEGQPPARAVEAAHRAGDDELAALRQDLGDSRRQLEETIQELESLNEEYRSAHEEALSANEELQSSNEELETAKEELQSGNEELTTVNDELQSRSAELSQTNNDLTNVLSSVNMPVILVGSDLRLRRFTPMATKVLNVIASDVGRPLSDLTLNMPVPDLTAVVLETIETMQPHEQDVKDREGRWYSMRVRPYRTHEHKIDGAVLMLVDIDDLRRALATADGAREYAEAVVTTVREPLVVLDDTIAVVTANRGFYDTFKMAPEQTEGRSLYDLGDREWDVPQLRQLLEEVIPQQKAFEHFEITHSFPGIGPRTMLLNARRIEDRHGHASRILLAFEDITERRQAEDKRERALVAAQHAQAEAEDVGDLLRRVQAITDTALLKLSFDDLLHEILERVREALGGDTAVILLSKLEEDGDEEEEVLRARAAIGLDDTVREGVRVPIGHGFAGRIAATRAPVILDDIDYTLVVSPYIREKGLRSLVGVPLLTEGGLLGVLHVGSVRARKFGRRDVELLMLAAERIAHAVEVAARRESERRMRAAAEAANRAKDDFLALLSHELRNPLSAVRNAVLAARLDPSRRERALELAGRQSEHLTRLVDDLLDVARITQGKIRLRLERVRLRDVTVRAIESARAFVEGRGHTLSLVSTGDGTVEGDPARLEQIVENLVTNAAKYTPPGGRMEIEIDHPREEAVLRVRDNGMGIPAETLPRIFDLFSQGDTHLDRSQAGLGIGLTVVRRLVELHGGKIEARSEGLGRGSEFIVRLPALPATESAEPEHRQAAETGPSARVLVVEDNPDVAEALQILLEEFGHRVRIAHDGPAALRAAAAEAPDIVLVDIGLPGMNGYEVARHLREQPGLKHVTLVALSGYGRDEDKARALAAGFHLHLTKPVDPDRLQALMAELRTAESGV